MKHLQTIYPVDVDANAPAFDYATFKPRAAVRAIVFDQAKVALVHVREHGYYMLPGGGLNEGDDYQTALIREIQEELGCEVNISDEVGAITVYFDRWHQKQTDLCYTARKTGDMGNVRPTTFEITEGHAVVWAANLAEAIRLVREATPANRDGKLVRARDLQFLEYVSSM